jgi:hypothetical protein
MGALQISNDDGSWTDVGSEPYRGGLFDDVEDDTELPGRRPGTGLTALPMAIGPSTLVARLGLEPGGRP